MFKPAAEFVLLRQADTINARGIMRAILLSAAVALVAIGQQAPALVPANASPAALAGSDRTVAVGQRITLDGSGSTDADGDRLSFAWDLISGPAGTGAKLSDPHALRPQFTVDLLGEYVFELRVFDGQVESVASRVTLSTANSRPHAIANIESSLVEQGDTVFLDGSGSYDPDGDTLSYSWELLKNPSQSQIRLHGAHAVRPALTLDAVGEYVVELRVNDASHTSAPVRVHIRTGESRLLAMAGGDRRSVLGRTLQLESESTGTEGRGLAYEWSLLYTPQGSNSKLRGATAPRPSLQPDRAGLYLVQLIVDDGVRRSAPDTMVIEAGLPGVDLRQRGGTDTDGDGVPDAQDNCLLTQNPLQRDTDGDGFGNFCDADLNNDTIIDFLDLGIMKQRFFSNDPDADLDGSGFVDFVDLGIMKSTFFGNPGPTGFAVWTNALGGDWDDPNNWFPVGVPGPDASALIDVNPGILVTHSTGSHQINAILSNNDFELSGGTLDVATDFQINADLTLSGGTLASARVFHGAAEGAGSITVAFNANVSLDGVTLAADMTVTTAADVTVLNGLTLNNSTITLASESNQTTNLAFNGTQTFGGTGEVLFGGSSTGDSVNRIYAALAGQTLTIGSGITIRTSTTGGTVGLSSTRGLINQGTILSNVSGRSVTVRGNLLTNEGAITASGGGELIISDTWSNAASGTISATDGALTLNGDWTNAGVINATNTDFTLDGDFTLADLGTINTTGTVNVIGTLDNTGTTLDLDAVSGNWLFGTGARINDGEIAGSSVMVIAFNANVILDGVTLTADMTITTAADVTVLNGLTLNNSTITLASESNQTTNLVFNGTQTFGGTGEVLFGGSSTGDSVNRIYAALAGQTLTIGSGITIRTSTTGGTVGLSSTRGLINQGTILSNVSGRSVTVRGNLLTNEGAITASGGGELIISDTWSNAASGTISATDGALTLNGDWTNAGVINATNTDFTLDGDFTLADLGTINTTGTVNVIGTLDNTGTTLDLDAVSGNWLFGTGARINDGEIAGSSVMVIAFNANVILDGVTLTADMTITTAADVTVLNGLTLNNSTITLASESNQTTNLVFNGTQTFGGTGEVLFGGSSTGDSVNRIYAALAGQTLTIGSGITIRTSTTGGTVGLSSTRGLINQGTILSNVSGRSVTVRGNLLTNEGAITASGGGELIISDTWSNAASGTISATDGALTLNGDWTNAGVINATNTDFTLDGDFTLADLGTINTTGTVNVIGTLDNTGTTLDLDAVSGNWLFGTGARINDGEIAGSSVMVIAFNANVILDGVTLTADMTITTAADVTVLNGLTLNNSTITLASESNQTTNLAFNGTQTFGGTGEVLFGGSSTGDSVNRIYAALAGQTLTIGSGITIRTSTTGGTVGLSSTRGLVSQGTIESDIPGRSIVVQGLPLTIDGTLAAGAGGLFDINTDYTLTATSSVDIDIGGAATTDFGRVTGAGVVANLGGTLNLALVDGFTPSAGNTFEILDFASRNGVFAAVNGTNIGGGLTFDVAHNATDVTLTVVTLELAEDGSPFQSSTSRHPQRSIGAGADKQTN